MLDDVNLLSAKDVAKLLKVSEQHIRSLIRKNELQAIRLGKQWVVQKESFDKYIKDCGVTIEPDDHIRKSDEVPDIVALSFFSGAMGLDIGMKNAGINALLACEFDKACRMTIEKNNPDIALIGDIWDYSADEILEMARIPKGRKVDIIFGGPPCQAFSTAGNRKGFDDKRGNALLRYISIISEILPQYVVIENVRGLLSAPYLYLEGSDEPIKGGALLHIINQLRGLGYSVSFNLYNAANFGAPQIRERVVIIGCLGNEKVPYLTPTNSASGEFGLPKWKTLKDAWGNLPTTEHHYVNFPEERLYYYRMLKAGQYWKDLPVDMQKQALGKSYFLGGGKTGFLRRLSFDKPSPTLVTHPAMPATDLAHPIKDRPLSVEEYSCIQGFPSNWVICGALLDQYKQIGNAVPIKLGEAIGNTILNHMNGNKINKYKNFPYSRYKNTDEVSWENDVIREIQKQKRKIIK